MLQGEKDQVCNIVDELWEKVPELPEKDLNGGDLDTSDIWARIFTETADQVGCRYEDAVAAYDEREYILSIEEMLERDEESRLCAQAEAREARTASDAWRLEEANEHALQQRSERSRRQAREATRERALMIEF